MSGPAVGLKIRQRRKDMGITQAAMARKIGISASYLNLIEANARIAANLKFNVGELSGARERRISDDLRELPADPLLQNLNLEPAGVEELVTHHPDWARALLTVYRAYLDGNQKVSALSDRLSKDPDLQHSVHQMLTHITSIRSTAEILHDEDTLDTRQLRQFYATLSHQSSELSRVAQELVSFFHNQKPDNESQSSAEEVDDFIIGHNNHFPELELAANSLRKTLAELRRSTIDSALEEYLAASHGTSTSTGPVSTGPVSTGQAGVQYGDSSHSRSIYSGQVNSPLVLSNTAPATYRFQLARVAAEQCFHDLIDVCVNDPRLTTQAARTWARRTLGSYIAGAVLMPYRQMLDEAQTCRYDIDGLSRRFQCSFEQVCHRLVTLRDPKFEGIPFAFLRADPSGYITKRFPLFGFSLPRYGHGCPLWVIYSAFRTPQRVVRQVGEFPGGGRFLMLARTVTKSPSTFRDPGVRHAVMLACDHLHADKTIYAEGLDMASPATIESVGPGCRLCSRTGCQQRQEAAVAATSFKLHNN